MTIDPTGAGTPGLVDRAKNILLNPRAEWSRIASESTGLSALLTGYVLPLAAVGAVASVIGSMLFLGMLFGSAGLIPALIGAVIGVAFTLLGVFLCGLLVNALASSFGSTPNQMRANQLAAYSSTAALVGSWGAIIPFLGWLFALAGGIYSIVLFYMGLTPMMQTPEDKRALYAIVLALIAIVAYWIIGMIVAMMLLTFGLGVGGAMTHGFSFNQNAPVRQSEVTLPDGTSVDLGQLEAAAGAAVAAGNTTPAVDPARLQGFLPQTLPGGFTQTSLSSSSSGAMGMNASQAEAEYQRGDARMTVTVVHMGAMGGIAAMAGSMNVQESSQDANGYTRTSTVNGRVISEQVDRGSNHASYGVVGRGVALTAEGNGISIDEARAAVDTIGIARVEAVGG